MSKTRDITPKPEWHLRIPSWEIYLLTSPWSQDLENGVNKYGVQPTFPRFPHDKYNAAVEQLSILQFHQTIEKITMTPNQVDIVTLNRSRMLSACI